MLIYHSALYNILNWNINVLSLFFSSLLSALVSPPVDYYSNNNHTEATGRLLNLFCSKVNLLVGPHMAGIITTMIAFMLCVYGCVCVCVREG